MKKVFQWLLVIGMITSTWQIFAQDYNGDVSSIEDNEPMITTSYSYSTKGEVPSLKELKKITVEALKKEWAGDWVDSDESKITVKPGSYEKKGFSTSWMWNYNYNGATYWYLYTKINGENGVRVKPDISIKNK